MSPVLLPAYCFAMERISPLWWKSFVCSPCTHRPLFVLLALHTSLLSLESYAYALTKLNCQLWWSSLKALRMCMLAPRLPIQQVSSHQGSLNKVRSHNFHDELNRFPFFIKLLKPWRYFSQLLAGISSLPLSSLFHVPLCCLWNHATSTLLHVQSPEVSVNSGHLPKHWHRLSWQRL